MTTGDMIRELRRLEEVHRDDFVGTGEPNWSLMCRDVANRLEELLKAQEPRVMTVEEVGAWVMVKRVERKPIYVEIRDGVCAWFVSDEYWDMPIDAYLSSDLYGKSCRCWTSRPTDEQREETPWN